MWRVSTDTISGNIHTVSSFQHPESADVQPARERKEAQKKVQSKGGPRTYFEGLKNFVIFGDPESPPEFDDFFAF